MEFLDSIEVESTQKKSHRVRSWYLYEQYKSLEKNQIDAAQKLKEKSFQERLLQQELSERRARRRLSGAGAGARSERSRSPSDNDFFESLCEMEEEAARRSDGTSAHALADPLTPRSADPADGRGDASKSSSFDSVVENLNPDDSLEYDPAASLEFDPAGSNSNLADDIKEELEFVKKSIAENMNLQLETVKGNMQCLEEFTKLREESPLLVATVGAAQGEDEVDDEGEEDEEVEDSQSEDESEDGSVCSATDGSAFRDDYSTNVYALWSKLVSFAYQIVQMNHGNCYYDYSSQFLTAVLACDVLRRGVNKMCRILQPYVSPIKYATETISSCSIKIQKHVKRKLSSTIKKSKNAFQINKNQQKKRRNPSRGVNKTKVKSLSAMFSGEKRYHLTNWRLRCLDYEIDEKNRIASEPWQSLSLMTSDKYSSTIWPDEMKSRCSDEYCSCRTRVANPMLKLASYIDGFLKEIGDSSV